MEYKVWVSVSAIKQHDAGGKKVSLDAIKQKERGGRMSTVNGPPPTSPPDLNTEGQAGKKGKGGLLL